MNAEDVIAEVRNMTDKRIRRFSEPGRRRGIRRPEEILRDVRGLKLRQRVSLVLGDEILREELEDTIKNSTLNGVSRADTIRTFQDFLLPTFQPSFASVGVNGGGGMGAVLPINDLRGENSSSYSKSERVLRCKLACVYRLVDIFGWSEAIFNHISVRVGSDKDEFLLNPFGLLFSEVSASSLLKCNAAGDIIDGGSTSLALNKAGFVLHSTIHEARPDLMCAIHVHTPDVIAVSSMKCGFLRLSQESLIIGEVTYHDYCGILVNDEEKESIKNDLGPTSKVMFLRNHGVIICGETIEEAFLILLNVMEACETQVKSIPIGLDNLNIISEEAYQQVQDTIKNSQKIFKADGEGKPKMPLHNYVFEAYMRWLDSQGYRTGYPYHMPDVFISGSPKKAPPSQIPPQVTSDRNIPYQNYYNQQENAVRRAPSLGRNTYHNRVKWLNRPVQGTKYMKEERQVTPPELADEPVVNGMTNGHIEETESVTETAVNGDTKIITKTTTVTETKLVTDQPKEPMSQEIGLSEPNPVNGITNGNESHDSEPPIDEKLDDSTSSLLSPSEEPTPSMPNEEGKKSPTKVKKSKSFKKAFMKKFNKKEKEEKSAGDS